jgi:hypothetical protein
MRVRLLAPLAAALVAGTLALTAGTASAAPAPAAPQATAPAGIAGVSAPLTYALPNGDTFTGTFTPTHFSNRHGQLLVTGIVTGTVTGATAPTGAITPQTITTTVSRASAPAATTARTGAAAPAQAAASCTILDLVLGPLHLNLLGLVVDLNQVHLTITAQQGAGNLLGNLLCAVANLLNGNGTLGGLSDLLNRILAILQGL